MLVYIRGAGDLASGIGVRLHNAGLRVVMSDLEVPTAVRRSVSFSEAIRLERMEVEGVEAVLARDILEAQEIIDRGQIPVLVDSTGKVVRQMKPDVEIDAIVAKKNLGTKISDASVVIGVGPGFCAGKDCHAVIESMRGHTLGRAIYEGSAIENTGIPGNIAGFTVERVFRAPKAGKFCGKKTFGDLVKRGEVVAFVDQLPIVASIDGMIRGMLQDGVEVFEGMKCGDIDPRGEQANYTMCSDKAFAIAGGVLEAIVKMKVS